MNDGRHIEIAYIDPDLYSSIVNHEVRKRVLHVLYLSTQNGPISKQDLADQVGVGYHQLVYQLNNHLKDFWTVVEERKVRGTRMELIGPVNRWTVYITIGKDNSIYIVDPPSNIFGALAKNGTRCDSCPSGEAVRCLEQVQAEDSQVQMNPTEAEKALLLSNGRKHPFSIMDYAIINALRGLSGGERCILNIPCDGCSAADRQIVLIS